MPRSTTKMKQKQFFLITNTFKLRYDLCIYEQNTSVNLLTIFNKYMQLCHPQPFSQYRMLPLQKKEKKKDCCLHPRTFPLLPFIFTYLVTITIVILPVLKLHTKALTEYGLLCVWLIIKIHELKFVCEKVLRKKKSGENTMSKLRNHWLPLQLSE